MESIDLYAAIAEMRRITSNGGCFSFIFRSYDRDRRTGGEVKIIKRARVRKSARLENVKHAGFKLFFTDLEKNEPRVCWQPAILFFNGKKITLQ
jgi:hypothetical protein